MSWYYMVYPSSDLTSQELNAVQAFLRVCWDKAVSWTVQAGEMKFLSAALNGVQGEKQVAFLITIRDLMTIMTHLIYYRSIKKIYLSFIYILFHWQVWWYMDYHMLNKCCVSDDFRLQCYSLNSRLEGTMFLSSWIVFRQR